MVPERLGIIGLGSTGGSVAWQAVRAGVPRVVGYALERRNGVAAARAGAVTELTMELKSLVSSVDLVVIDAPPRRTFELLTRLAEALVAHSVYCTDLTPVKAVIAARAAKMGLARCFAGSHLLCELGREGFDKAQPGGLRGEVVYVTPVSGGDRAAAEIADFWKRVFECQPVVADPAAHDRIVNWTSHLPQTVAAALARALAHQGPRGGTYGSNALSVTQAAMCRSEEWAEILVLNQDELLSGLEAVEREIQALRVALAGGGVDEVVRWLEAARVWREGLEQ